MWRPSACITDRVKNVASSRARTAARRWKRTLFKDPRSGAVDIVIDANNPSVIYAALWEAYRIEYQMSSGGPGSGMYKSTDGGETWTEITRNPGLPSGVVGRIGLANTKADSNRVYALVENENGGLFVSDDAGASWKLINANRAVRQRAFYYTHVFGDPSNKDVVYMQNTALFRSTDGGKTTVQVGQNTHGDHHDLWVDPDDPNHVVDGNDGGGAITYDITSRVPNWSAQDFPTAQWYHVITTAHLPYHVCGSQQDNSTLCVPSNTNAQGGGFGGNPPVAPYQAGGGEPGYIAHARDRPGHLLWRHQQRLVPDAPQPPHRRVQGSRRLSALLLRRAVEGREGTLAVDLPDHLFVRRSQRRSTRARSGSGRRPTAATRGSAISGDLTRHDPKTMQDSGGPITHDMNSPEIYGTVFSLAPGKKDVNMLWAGSDDGLVHVTRDDGKNWTNVTPPAMPDFGRVSQLDGSSFDNGTAYMAVKKMLLGDRSPYIFRPATTASPGRRSSTAFPPTTTCTPCAKTSCAAACSTPGTQHGVYISFDDGDNWLKFSNGLPDVPVTDLVVEDNAHRDRHARPQLLRDGRHRGAAAVRPGAAHRRGGVQAGQRHARARSADRHLLPEDPAEAADDRLPRCQGPGGALDQRPAAPQSRRHRRRRWRRRSAGRRARRWPRASTALRGT